MNNLAEKIKLEKYHDSIRYFAHRRNGADRHEFILQIAKHSLFLAARTAMTCAKDSLLIDKLQQLATDSGEKAKQENSVSIDAILCAIALKKFVLAVNIFPIGNENKDFAEECIIGIQILENSGDLTNENVLAILIGLSPDYEVAMTFYKAMGKLGIKPDVVVYSNLIGKSLDYKTALTWYQVIKEENLTPIVNVYNNLIDISPDYKTALAWYQLMKDKKLMPTVDVYNNLISHSPDYKTALTWYQLIKDENLIPIVNVYNNLISKSPDYKTALTWYQLIKDEKLILIVNIYGNLIGKSPDYKTALEWYQAIKDENLIPVIEVYNNLIAKSLDYKTALTWYKQLKDENLIPYGAVYHNMIGKSSTLKDKKSRFEVAKKYFDKAIQDQLILLKDTYYFMIVYSLHYKQAYFYFKAMEQAGYEADVDIFKLLLKKANFTEKQIVEKIMKERGINLITHDKVVAPPSWFKM